MPIVELPNRRREGSKEEILELQRRIEEEQKPTRSLFKRLFYAVKGKPVAERRDAFKHFQHDVKMKQGRKSLAELEVGDEIATIDPVTKEKKINKVEKAELLMSRAYYYLINDMPFHRNQSVVLADGVVKHVFQLEIDDWLVDGEGNEFQVCDIQKVWKPYPFFKLNVDGDHTYVLNGVLVHNASRYWVGGTANWDGTAGTKWAATSGGGGGSSVPTTSDDAFFDANSNTGGSITVTVASGNTGCNNLDFTGFTRTFAGSAALTINGNLTLVAAMTRTYTGTITFSATTTGKTITSNGKALGGAVTFNGVGGAWTLQDAFNIGSSLGSDLTLTNGTFDTNGFTLTCYQLLSSNSNTRVLTLGASTVSAQVQVSFSTSTNMTLNAGTSHITMNNSGTQTFAGGGLTFYNVTIGNGGSNPQCNMSGANTFNNLTFNTTAQTGNLTLSANQTVNGTFTCSGSNAGAGRGVVQSNTTGTSRTITAAVVSLTNVDFIDITGAGAGTWSGTSVGNGGGNSGITFTTPVTRYWIGGTGNYSSTGEWAASSGGASGASVPICHDTAIFDANSFSGAGQTVTMDVRRTAGMDFSAATNNPTFTTSNNFSIFGSLIFKAGMTLSATSTYTLCGRGSYSLNFAGITRDGNVTLDAPGGTYTLTGNCPLGSTRTFTLTSGALALGAFTLTCQTFSSSNSNTRSIDFGSGTIAVTGNNATIISMATVTGFTATQGTGTFDCTYSGATGTRTITPGNPGAANAVPIKVSAGTDIVALTASDESYDLNFTGFAGSWTPTTFAIYGSLTLAAGMTINASSSTQTLRATSGTKTITSNGKTLDCPLTINAAGGTYQLADHLALGSTRTLNLSAGTFDANDKNVTCGTFSSSNSTTRSILMGSGTWNINGNSGQFNIQTQVNLTFNAETSTIKFGGATGSMFLSTGSNSTTFHNVWDAITSTGTLILSGTSSASPINVYNDIKIDAGKTFRFTGGCTYRVETFTCIGTVGNVINISNNGGSGQHILENMGVADISVEYTDLSNSRAIVPSGSTLRWYALLTDNNVDTGGTNGNEGWIFATGLPEVEAYVMTQAGATSATAEGNVASDNGTNITLRGFVFDTVTHADPGNVAPGSSGYANNVSDAGTWGSGEYSKALGTLSADTLYYVRAFAQNTTGYAYSAEMTFITPTYAITTWKQLHAMRYDINGVFSLSNNLGTGDTGYDTYASSLANGGVGWIPIVGRTGFVGTFDGNFKSITGLYITAVDSNADPSARFAIGFFGHLRTGADIHDLYIRDIEFDDALGNQIGGIAGDIEGGDVTQCHVRGMTVDGDGSYSVGGIVGWLDLGNLYRCSVEDFVVVENVARGSVSGIGGVIGGSNSGTWEECYATGAYFGDDNLGGFIGEHYSNELGLNCYARVDVTETQEFQDGGNNGGFVGYSDGDIEKCYSTGAVVTGDDLEDGGFAGDGFFFEVQDNFWDTETSLQDDDVPSGTDFATGKTTTEMKDIATYTGAGGGLTEDWDIVATRNAAANIWGIVSTINDGYPFLQGIPIEQAKTLTTEAITIQDTVVPTRIQYKVLDDIITMVDSVVKTPGKTLEDTVTVLDTVNRAIGRAILNAIVIVDDLVVEKGIFKFYTETITVTDSMFRTASKTLEDAITVVDTVTKSLGRALQDAVVLVQTMNIGYLLSFMDTVTLVDTLIKKPGKALAETVVVSDLITFFKRARGFILGRDNDTNTGVGTRKEAIKGKKNNTNTNIGTRL